MKKVNVLILSLGLASLSAGMNSAMSQNNNETRQGSMRAPDAVSNAQMVRETSITRPEQKKSEHDRSNIFAPPNAAPSSPAFDGQPDKGKILGFDFYRDPLNAKKPMQTFEEIMKADVADRAKVMKTQHELLLRRYDLTPRLDREAKMSRGKPLAVGPTARLAGGISWQKLSSMSPSEMRSQNAFPYPALPHPKQTPGGQVFPQVQVNMFPRLERFDIEFDLPEAFLPEFPPAIFLQNRPELGDVSRGEVAGYCLSRRENPQ